MLPKIAAIPAFKDNYIWALIEKNHVAIVDPGDAAPVIAFLQKEQLTLTTILVTHHHWDHTNGVEKLVQNYPGTPVYGSKTNALVTCPVQAGDEIVLGMMKLTVLAIPGHTLDHLAYYNTHYLFCGDTLFSAGCGRIFEGTTEQMYHSLQQLAALSAETKIYCGHEYTLNNLLFAQLVEPDNQSIAMKLAKSQELRSTGNITLPSTMVEEKQTNPFLRCTELSVIQAAEKHAHRKLMTPVEVFTVLREWKNQF